MSSPFNKGAGSPETQQLREIDSTKKSFANKDFVKNIAFLNNSVDTLSAYTQKLQAGVDQANGNILTQIEGVFSDLFILFAGGEPTGIDVGDLGYVLQGIGAFFGIDPDTPFPLNLVDATEHILTTYLIPLPQFTDVIFDSIEAWAEDAGLSTDFINSLKDLANAIIGLGASFGDLFSSLGDLLGAFGFLGMGDGGSGIGTLWDALIGLINGIDLSVLKPVISLLADLGIPFINALTDILRGGSSFLGWISGDQVRKLGSNISPAATADTRIWGVGGSSATAWIFDAATSLPTLSTGSFTTLGNGIARRLLTETMFICTPGDKIQVGGQLKWSGVPTASVGFGFEVVFFNGLTEESHLLVPIASGHGANGGFSAVTPTTLTVPSDVDGMKLGYYVDASVTSGQVWGTALTVQRIGEVDAGILGGLLNNDVIPFLDAAWINTGTFLSSLIPGLDASKIISGVLDIAHVPGLDNLEAYLFGGEVKGSNLVTNGTFDSAHDNWPSNTGAYAGIADGLFKHSGLISRKITLNGTTIPTFAFAYNGDSTVTTLAGNYWNVKDGDHLYAEAWVYAPVSNSTFQLNTALYSYNTDSTGVLSPNVTAVTSVVDINTTSKGAWLKLHGYYTIPAGYDRSTVYVGFADAGHNGDVIYVDSLLARETTEVQNVVATLWGNVGHTLGVVLDSIVPGLDASKIISGSFAQSLVTNLGTDLTTIRNNIQSTWDGIVHALGGPGSGNIITDLTNAIAHIPGANIVSAVLASIIPALDASKIATGQFAQSFVTGLSTALAQFVSSITGMAIAGSNTVLDGQFRDNTISREFSGAGAGSGYSTIQAHSGTQCIKLVANGGYNAFFALPVATSGLGNDVSTRKQSTALKVSAGEKYYFEAWVFSPSANVAPNVINLTGYCRNSITGAETYPSAVAKSTGWTADLWTKLSGVITIPTGYDLFWPDVQCDPTVPVGNIYYIDDVIFREETRAQNILVSLFGGVGDALAQILAAAVPGLDASKITSGAFAQSIVTGLTTALGTLTTNIQATWDNIVHSLGGASSGNLITDLAHALSNIPGVNIVSALLASVIPGLDASKITSGAFTKSIITGLTSLFAAFSGKWSAGSNLIQDPALENSSLWNLSSGVGGVFSTAQKHSGTQSLLFTVPSGLASQFAYVTQDASTGTSIGKIQVKPGEKYYVEGWYFLPTANTGAPQVQIGAYVHDTTAVNADIFPSIVSATPAKNAWTKVSGYYTIPAGYDQLAIYMRGNAAGSGAIGDLIYLDDVAVREVTESQNIVAQLWGSVGATLTTILTSVIPGLDASKITSGAFAQSIVTGLTTALSTLTTNIQSTWDNIVHSLGGASSGNIITDVAHALANIPGANIVSALLAGVIPGLDASKIVSGAFAQSLITNLTTNLAQLFGFGGSKSSAGANLASDPDMSNANLWLSNTSGSGVLSISTDQHVSGTTSLKTVCSANGNFAVVGSLIRKADGSEQALVVKPGQKFIFSVKCRANAANAATQQVWIDYLASDSTGVNADVSGNGGTFLTTVNSSGWTTIQATIYTIPSGYDRLRLRVVANNATSISGDSYYWDDPVIKEVTETQDIIASLWGSVGAAITGAIQALSVPLLDASKIATGQFATSFVMGLDTDLTNINNTIQSTWDTIVGGLGGSSSGNIITDLENAIAGIPTDLANIGANATKAVNNINTIIHNVGGTIVDDISDAINTATNVFDQIGKVLSGHPVTPVNSAVTNVKAFADDYAATQAQTVTNTVKAQNYTISVQTGAPRNPSWMCRYPIGDVVYPEFFNLYAYTIGTSGAQSAGTAHTHGINIQTSSAAFTVGNSQNQSLGSYITTANTTIYDTVGMGLNRSAAINNVFMEVFLEKPDGSLVLVSSQDVSSLLTTTYQYIEMTLPAPVIAQAGERWLVRIRNSSTVAANVGVIGVAQSDNVNPDISFSTTTTAVTNLTAYTTAQATNARAIGDVVTWGLLAAKGLNMTDRLFADSFKRSALGGQWLTLTTGSFVLGITDGELSYTGTATGDQTGNYTFILASAACKTQGTLTFNPLSTAAMGLTIHCARDFSQMVYLQVTPTRADIMAGPAGSLVSQAHVTLSGLPADINGVWAIYYDQTPGATKYVVLKDGVAVSGLEWDNPTGLIHDTDHQYGGARISCASSQPAGTIADWSIQDYVIAVPATVTVPRMAATATMVPPTVSVLNVQSTSGAWSYAVPSWVNSVDLIGLAGGGGGGNAGGFNYGGGGSAGGWVTRTLVRGVDFTGAITITGTVGAGGSAGTAGNNTVINIPVIGTITATGGARGSNSNNGGSGSSSGDTTFDGYTYPGGIGGSPGTSGSANAAFGSGGCGAVTSGTTLNGTGGRTGAIWVRGRA